MGENEKIEITQEELEKIVKKEVKKEIERIRNAPKGPDLSVIWEMYVREGERGW